MDIIKEFVVVTDFFDLKNCEDVAYEIQNIIDKNPNRTIYFPDGEYTVKRPIVTPADPRKSVSLKLSDFAVIRVADGWDCDEAVIRLGGKDPANDIFTVGSNYGFEGGIIDCGGVANGISIDSGRETYVRSTSIKNAVIGLHIKYGTNCGSSDSDISNVNITGNGEKNSIGVLVDGYDNTFTNMRIGHVFMGVVINTGGNILRNIHPLYYTETASYPYYSESIGFMENYGRNNWFDFCYSDQFCVGFRTTKGGGTYTNCFSYWYSPNEPEHIALLSDIAFAGRVSGFTVGGKEPENSVNVFSKDLEVTEDAVIRDVTVNGHLCRDFNVNS